MDLVSWIAVGIFSGWLTGMLMTGNGYGVIGDILFGITGGLGGGFLAATFVGANGTFDGFNIITIMFALVGAAIFICIIRLLPRRGLA
jgi:uncharacterized membrane protein YeaQ/YmgE (transglycosylase-associated protein family)